MIQSCLLVSQDDRSLDEESRNLSHTVQGTEEDRACKVKEGKSIVSQTRTTIVSVYLQEKDTPTREEGASLLGKLKEESTDDHALNNK
jgi:hypothetical protein